MSEEIKQVSAIDPDMCSVFIQVWVDTNAVDERSGTKGVYLVDNRVGSGSDQEGTPGLATACSKNAYVCWQIFNASQWSRDQVNFKSIGNSNAWGPSGQPQAYNAEGTIFTGQVQNPGNSNYPVTINVTKSQGSGITVGPFNPVVRVGG